MSDSGDRQPAQGDAARARMRAERVTALVRMLRAFGQEATKERLQALGELTDPVPQHLFAAAVNRATLETRGGWPPGPGDIMRAAVDLEPAELNPGQPRGLPRWYRRAIGERTRAEMPREIGPRDGVAKSLSDRVSEAAGGDR